MFQIKDKALAGLIAGFLFFCLCSVQSHAEEKPLLKGTDGKYISGEIIRISGSDAEVATLEGTILKVPLDDLSNESRKTALTWGLAKILPNPQMFQIQPRVSRRKSGSRGYEMTLTNLSPMDIPAGLEIRYAVRVDTRKVTSKTTRKRQPDGTTKPKVSKSVELLDSQYEGYYRRCGEIP